MVCDEVRRFVYFFLDGELTNDQSDGLRQHLSDCPGCDERLLIQKRLRTFLRNRLAPSPAPDQLRIKLQAVFARSAAERA